MNSLRFFTGTLGFTNSANGCMAVRATGILLDGRVHRQGYTPPPPYATLGVRPATDERGYARAVATALGVYAVPNDQAYAAKHEAAEVG